MEGACTVRCWSGSLRQSRRRAARRQLGCVRFRGLDGHGNVHERHNNTQREAARREDVAPGQSLVHQTGLHRWRPGLAPEPQRAVRPNEIVVAPQELDVSAARVFATRVAWRTPTQVRRPVTNREVETLDERGVQGRGSAFCSLSVYLIVPVNHRVMPPPWVTTSVMRMGWPRRVMEIPPVSAMTC